MRISRIGLGIVALFSAVLSTASRAGLFWSSLGGSFPLPPGWLGTMSWLIGVASLVGLILTIGVWRLATGRRGAGVLLAAALCSLVSVIGSAFVLPLLAPVFRPLGTLPIVVLNWVALAAAFLFAVGLLVSGLVPRWVAWVGLASSLASAPAVLVPRALFGIQLLFGLPLHGFLAGLSDVLGLVFLIALGVSLIWSRLPDAPASNKGIERTA